MGYFRRWHFDRALVYRKLGRLDDSAAEYRSTIGLDGQFAPAYVIVDESGQALYSSAGTGKYLPIKETEMSAMLGDLVGDAKELLDPAG